MKVMALNYPSIFWPTNFINYVLKLEKLTVTTSVTRLGNLLGFGKLCKAFGNNQFAQISHILGLVL